MILIFVFVLSILVLQLLKAHTKDSKGERNQISKQAEKNVNEKGRLEQAMEKALHVEHIENYFMLNTKKKSFSLYFFGCLTPNGIVDLICTFFFF
jgi:type IV secretory pathway protease TraF